MWRPDKMVTHFISVFIIRNVREFAFLSCAALFRNLNSPRSHWWCWNKTIYFYPSRLFSYILTFDDGSSSMRSKESEDREPLFVLSFFPVWKKNRSFVHPPCLKQWTRLRHTTAYSHVASTLLVVAGFLPASQWTLSPPACWAAESAWMTG